MKKNKTIYVLTEGGRKTGFGHIARTIALSTEFQCFGFQIQFIVNGDKSVSSMLNYPVNLFDWTVEQNRLFDILRKDNIILLDSMLISDEQILSLQAISKNIIFIDDEKRRNILDKGFVLDWTVLSDEKNYFYPKKYNVHYLLGSKYTPLRKEFTEANKCKIRKNIQSVMITFGGSDVRNLSPFVLKILQQNFPKLYINVIIGAGFTNLEEIEKYTSDHINLIHNATSQTMIKTIQNSDIAIAAGGQTLYELAKIGLPTIAILLVENAKEDTIGWAKVGSLINVGWWNEDKLQDNLINAIEELKSFQLRSKMQKSGEKYIGVNGANEIAKTIMENL